MRIDIYLGRGERNADTVRTLVDEAIQEASAGEVEVNVITVDSPEEARAKKMLGSPTIRVNNVDIEYGDREPDETTNGGRYYSTPEGWKPMPSRGMIVRAIQVQKRREQGS